MKTSLWIQAIALGAFALASPLAALSQPSAGDATESSASKSIERGRVHFLRGVDFFKEGNFAAALVEFKRANQTAPNYRILFNLAQTYLELHDYANALRSFEEYLESGGAEVRPARRAEVEEEIRKLRGRVAVLTIRSNLAESELLIDDNPSGNLPLTGPMLISAGRHTVSMRKNGTVRALQVVEVSGGDSATVELSATAPEPPPSPAPAVAAAPTVEPSPGKSTAFWVSLTSASALAVGTAVTGILALNAQSDLNHRLSSYPGSPSDISSARTNAKQMALTADILGGATVAAAALTLFFALQKPAGLEADATSTRLAARIGPGGLVLEQRF